MKRILLNTLVKSGIILIKLAIAIAGSGHIEVKVFTPPKFDYLKGQNIDIIA